MVLLQAVEYYTTLGQRHGKGVEGKALKVLRKEGEGEGTAW